MDLVDTKVEVHHNNGGGIMDRIQRGMSDVNADPDLLFLSYGALRSGICPPGA
jgi:hypothetical protein